MELGTDEIFIARKIRLLPTKEQEELFWKSAGVARWAYNFFLSENRRVYECEGRYASGNEIRKVINNVLKPNTHQWLKEVSSNVMKQAVKDAEYNLKRFFKNLSGFPKFKSKHKSKPSFYVNYESLKRTQNGFRGEKLGNVKTVEPLPKVSKYYEPRIIYDGKYWYLSIKYKAKKGNVKLTDEVLGIDIGVKELAVVSNKDGSKIKIYRNINKTVKVRKLEKCLKREQRKVSRKIAKNTSKVVKNKPVYKRPLKEMKNLQKQQNKVRSVYKRLYNIRQNYLHQVTTEIVKTKPSKIVMENLNVSGMMKNKHLAKSLAEQKLYEFKRMMEYKTAKYNIEFVLADRFYPSSKTCSKCGSYKKDLKLSDRTYKCPVCGLEIDRDLNAAINLANLNNVI